MKTIQKPDVRGDEILRLIETVDSNNECKMCEINARVYCFLNDCTFLEPIVDEYRTMWRIQNPDGKIHNQFMGTYIDYSRSRDALKAIRPEAWQPSMNYSYGGKVWNFMMIKWGERCTPLKYINQGDRFWFATEELAELHAIIQAIQYERDKP